MMESITVGNITITQDWLTPIGVALVLLSFYWFRRAYRRYRGRLRYTNQQQEAIREKARRSL